MGCKNSTVKGADKSKTAAVAPRAAEKPKSGVPADDATHITVISTPAAATPTPPPPLEPRPVKEDAAKEEAVEEKADGERAAEKQIAEEEATVAKAEVATAPEQVDPAELPAVASPPENLEGTPAAPEGTEAPTPAAPASHVATAPAEEDDLPPQEQRRPAAATAPIHQSRQTQCIADLNNSHYVGPGPAETFPIDNIYRCFEEGNGLLFRLVNRKRHMWAFYNDTVEYMMRVSVTFGPESRITALDDTHTTTMNVETGECTLFLEVPPGETRQFMRGEYNGFTTSYDAEPLENLDEKLEAAHDDPVLQPLEFTAIGQDGANESNGNAVHDEAFSSATRVHLMEADPTPEEPEVDLKKRREEA